MISVIKPGMLTTVQDEGRWGYQAFGMPVAGVMDRYAYRTANILAGNAPGAAALEMTVMGGIFRFDSDAYVAVCGADMQGTLNGKPIRNWSCFLAPAGSELAFGFIANGCRTYIAVRGGIAVPLVLGSRSTYTRAAVGGLEGRALQAGDVLKIGSDAARPPRELQLPAKFVPKYPGQVTLRVMLGPQDDLFTPQGVNTLFDSEYEISPEADRMGYRMEGPVIEHTGKADIVSDAICQGAIQVPGHGRPIVMMADRATTGGYTKIGTVIGPDLSLLAQCKPGDKVRFERCTDEEAVKALEAEQEKYVAIETFAKEGEACKPARTFRVTVAGKTYNLEVREV